ncbi:MAG: hypothetical protein KAH25_12930, partial [Bacteroidales bacterium]|nr:hypothetical protein [Bacteroidales bacterium]
NSNYEVIYNQCLSFEKGMPTFPANASVFKPDPITSAHTVYGGEYRHNNGTNNPSLENEQIDVEIECYKENNTYYLKNNYCEIVDNDEPRWAPVTSDNGNFNYNRSQIGFQQVNAFYHISEMKKYLNSIGFEDAVDYSIEVDADGENGNDNSHFNSVGNKGNITFGAYIPQEYLPEGEKPEEHVPDAEDAEVIIHEYTHAISNSYNDFPISNERFTIEEAMADYMAVSYATNIDDHNWEKIFKWDAHNEFWDGRIATSTKCYSDIPYFPSNNYYLHSDVWTAPLMDIYFKLGKEATDKLVLHTIRSLGTRTTMEQAALIMMAMDTVYNNHENSMAILNTFKKYCILNDGHLSNDSYSMSRFKIINSKGFAQGGEMKIDFGYLLSGEIKIYDINGVNIFNKKINL